MLGEEIVKLASRDDRCGCGPARRPPDRPDGRPRLRDLQAALGRLDYSSVVLATGFAVLFFNSGTRYAFGLMLKPMTDDLGWSRSELSLALAAFMLVSALAMPIAGRLVDRYSIRSVLAVGGLIAALGIGLTGQVQSHWHIFVVYGLVYAVGHAATSIPTVSVMISRWFVRRRGLANSVAVSGNAVGQLVIIAVLASLLGSLGWRTSYAVLGAANLIIVVPLCWPRSGPVRRRRAVGHLPTSRARAERIPASPLSLHPPRPLLSAASSRPGSCGYLS